MYAYVNMISSIKKNYSNIETKKIMLKTRNGMVNTKLHYEGNYAENGNILEKILKKQYMTQEKFFENKIPVYKLTNNDAKKSLLEYLKTKYDIQMNSGNKYFKFMDQDDVTTLKTSEHLVYFNTNPKYFLLFCSIIKESTVYLLINKPTEDVYLLSYKSKKSYNGDCILEGEIINNSCYLVSDIIIYKGEKCNDSMKDKLKLLKDITNNIDENSSLKLQIKEFVPLCNTVSFIRDYLPSLSYKNIVNGLVFRPNNGAKNKNIIMILNKPFHNLKLFKNSNEIKTATSTIKIKEGINKIIFNAFLSPKGPDIIELFLKDKEDLVKYGIAFVPTIKNSLMLQNIFKEKNNCNLLFTYSEKYKNFVAQCKTNENVTTLETII
jgi:hypothetical protein